MKNNKKRGFTLIELIIASTIFFIMVTASFVPYNHYMNKAKVRTTVKEISQILYEARNMAVNGTSLSDSNISVGVYFDTENNDGNNIFLVSFPHNIIESQVTSTLNIIKEYKLQPKMNITEIGGQKNGLFLFKAITGDGMYYYFDSEVRTNLPQNENKIYIDFSYNGAVSGSIFAERIEYFTKTYIVDY